MAALKYRKADGTFGTIPVLQGPAGRGIENIAQTTTSTASGGTNIWTMTLNDGSSHTFSVKNGINGAKGDKGDKGDSGDLNQAMSDKQHLTNEDFNTITKSGVYRFEANSSHANSSPISYGQLLVLHATGDTIAQLTFDYSYSRVYLRTGNPSDVGGTGAWNAWKRLWGEGDAITGAVWNDYAEFRESDCEDFGYVLAENGDDTLSKTTERLQHFAGISSDTWGFCQGETEKAKTPIAVAGRVLAYPYRALDEYKPGDCVCAAPNGTVDIMTREEIQQYPDRIVGTVSCVPSYETWGSGDREPVQVNGRIWIKIK